MKITMDYPSLEEEVNILGRHNTNAASVKLDDIVPAITKEERLSLRAIMNRFFVDMSLIHIYPILGKSLGDLSGISQRRNVPIY